MFNINKRMYVCLCLGVSDRQVHAAIDDGACSAPEVMRCTGAGTCCGMCRSSIEDIVRRRDGGSDALRMMPLVPLPSVA